MIRNLLPYKILREIKNSMTHALRRLFSAGPRIRTIIEEHYRDKALGIETFEPLYDPDNVSTYKDGLAYFPSSYGVLEALGNYLKLSGGDVLVDYGSGKGRVLFYFATQKCAKLIGVEIRKELVDAANHNLKNFSVKNAPIVFLHEDALRFDPREGTVFFFFNPFGYQTFTAVIRKIKESLDVCPRKIRILYFNANYGYYLDEQNWLVAEGEIPGTKVLVWHN
jgi:predicted RNA methylase